MAKTPKWPKMKNTTERVGYWLKTRAVFNPFSFSHFAIYCHFPGCFLRFGHFCRFIISRFPWILKMDLGPSGSMENAQMPKNGKIKKNTGEMRKMANNDRKTIGVSDSFLAFPRWFFFIFGIFDISTLPTFPHGSENERAPSYLVLSA